MMSKFKWIFTRLGIFIDIVEIWFGIANDKFRQFMTLLSVCDTSIFLFKDNKLGKSKRIFIQLDLCIDIVEIWFAIEYILELSPHDDNGGVLSSHIFI